MALNKKKELLIENRFYLEIKNLSKLKIHKSVERSKDQIMRGTTFRDKKTTLFFPKIPETKMRQKKKYSSE